MVKLFGKQSTTILHWRALRSFALALASVVLLAACAGSDGTDYGSNSSSGGGGNGCSAGYCNSNGYCCPNGTVGCNGLCYSSTTDAYSATGNAACLSATTIC